MTDFSGQPLSSVQEDGAKGAGRWEQMSLLLYLLSSCLLFIQFLRLLARRGHCAGPGIEDGAIAAQGGVVRAAEETVRPDRPLPPNEETAFRAGVSTTFDVIAVLRELVNEALASPNAEAAEAKSPNGHGGWPSGEPQ